METTMHPEDPAARGHRRGCVRRQVREFAGRLGADSAGITETIETRPVVFRGHQESAVHRDRGGHVEVSFHWRHDLPEALAGFGVPASQGMLVVTHDLPTSAEFSADERGISGGESRRGPTSEE